jgi:hypothetical protein
MLATDSPALRPHLALDHRQSCTADYWWTEVGLNLIGSNLATPGSQSPT